MDKHQNEIIRRIFLQSFLEIYRLPYIFMISISWVNQHLKWNWCSDKITLRGYTRTLVSWRMDKKTHDRHNKNRSKKVLKRLLLLAMVVWIATSMGSLDFVTGSKNLLCKASGRGTTYMVIYTQQISTAIIETSLNKFLKVYHQVCFYPVQNQSSW